MQYNKIGEFKYEDSNSYIPLVSYIIYEDKNKERFALFKFENKSTIRANSYHIKLVQYDVSGQELQSDEISFDNLDVAVHASFVPFTRIMLHPNMDSFTIEALTINGFDAKGDLPLVAEKEVENESQVKKVKKRNKFSSRGVRASLLGLGLVAVVGLGVYLSISSINNYKDNLTEYLVDDFTINNQGKIVKYTGNAKNLVIPSRLANIAVTRIDNNVFSNNRSIETLSIDASSYIIGDSAFSSCTSLKSINLKGSVQIEAHAFENASKLTNASIADVSYIGSYAFSGTSLTEFSVDSNVTIASQAFYKTKLETFDCPNAILNQNCLGDSEALKTLSFKQSYSNMITDLFTSQGKMSLQALTTGDTSFSDLYFKGLDNLINLNFASNDFFVSNSCLEALSKLPTYSKIKGIEYIGDCALSATIADSTLEITKPITHYSNNFRRSISENNVIINLTDGDIAADLFSNDLQSLTIKALPSSATFLKKIRSINELHINALNNKLLNYFDPSVKINYLYVDGSGSIIPSYLEGLNSILNVVVSDDISSIGANFVNNNTSLKSIKIGEQTSLSSNVIGNCPALTKVSMPLDNKYSIYNSSYKNTKELEIVGSPSYSALSDNDLGIIKLTLHNTNVNLDKLNKLSILSLSNVSGKKLSQLVPNYSKLKTLIFDGVSVNGFVDDTLSNINLMLINGASLSSADASNIKNYNIYVDSASASNSFNGYYQANCLVYNGVSPALYANKYYSYVDYLTHKYSIFYDGKSYEYQSVFLDDPLMVIDGVDGKNYTFSYTGYTTTSVVYVNETNIYTYDIYESQTITITYYVDGEYYMTQEMGIGTSTLVSCDGIMGWYKDASYNQMVNNNESFNSNISLYGYRNNVLKAGANKIEYAGNYYINGNSYDSFTIKVYSDSGYQYRLNGYVSLSRDEYGICYQYTISNASGRYYIRLYSEDIVIIEGNQTDITVKANISEKKLKSVESTSTYIIDVSSIAGDNFLGLYTSDGIQITDEKGLVINQFALENLFDINNKAKLYARYYSN